MVWKAAQVTTLGVVLFSLWPAKMAMADDQQLVESYLQGRGLNGYAVRVRRPTTSSAGVSPITAFSASSSGNTRSRSSVHRRRI